MFVVQVESCGDRAVFVVQVESCVCCAGGELW